MGQYYNHYYEKFTEAIKLKSGYDLDHIIKYVLCKKSEQLQLQVSNICHVNNIYRTRCLSPMYRRAKLGQIQGGCRGPAKIRQRGGCNIFLLFTREK